jgi:hypothetical protein
MLGTLAGRGVAPESILALVTRYARRQHMVSLEDATQALGGARVQCLRSDYASAARAMDLGQLLSAAAPRSTLRRDMQDLAARIVAPVAAR